MITPKKNLNVFIILGIIIILCIIIITVSFKDSDLIKKAKASTLDFFKPVQEKTFSFFQPVIRFFNGIGDYFKLGEKIESLEKEKNSMYKDYSENINLKIENDALRKLLGLKIREEYETEAARVIGFNESNWLSEIILDVGRNNGVLEGMAVVNEDGLVGIVVLSGNNTCKVRLINDPQSSIGVRILSSRKLGIAEGNSDRKLYLKYISTEDLVFKGDIIITSEFGEYVPPEILIGRIKSISEIAGSPYRQIEIEPLVNFKNIEYVLILKNK